MDAKTTFSRLEEEFFREWVRRDPLRGTALGLHEESDAKLFDPSFNALQDEIRFVKRMAAQFEKVPRKDLPIDRQSDLDLILCSLKVWLFEREEIRYWECVPEVPRLIAESIFQILGRNYAPLKVRMKAIFERLEALPKLIRQAQTRLRRPVKLFVENELETITRLPAFYHNLREIGRLQMPLTVFMKLIRMVATVEDAQDEYTNWLIIDILPSSATSYGLKPDVYHEYLKIRGISESPRELLKQAIEEKERLKDKLRELARKIRRKTPPEDIRDRIKAQHPNDFDAVLRYVREEVHRCREFVSQSGFATIPQGESLLVVEMPVYMRHMYPFSNYWPPARYENKMEGYYFVSPGDCDSDKLKEFNYPALSNMTACEAYPGHHLFFSSFVRQASKARLLFQSPDTLGGWGIFCEERVRELGYDDSPPNRFMTLLGMLWRAVSVELDVKLSLGQISMRDGVNILIDETGMDRVAAEGEVRRHLISPGSAVASYWGREQFKKLRRQVRDRMKSHFTDRFFHDTILSAGALPIPLLSREMEWRADASVNPPQKK